MRKFVLAALSMMLAVGFSFAAAVTFVKFEDDKLTVKEGDKEATYKVTDKTTFKAGDKAIDDAEKAKKMLAKMKVGTKLEVTHDKDAVTEIKFGGGKKKADK